MEEQNKSLKKVKIIYTIELLIFVAVAITFSILFYLEIFPATVKKARIFSILTTCGAGYLIFDAIWAIISPKHRKNAPLIDKITILPLSFFLIGFDIYIYVNQYGETINLQFLRFVLGSVFVYIACMYTFQAIYHWYHPLQSLIEASEKAEEEAKALEAEEAIEAAKQEKEDSETTEVIEEIVEIEDDNK